MADRVNLPLPLKMEPAPVPLPKKALQFEFGTKKPLMLEDLLKEPGLGPAWQKLQGASPKERRGIVSEIGGHLFDMTGAGIAAHWRKKLDAGASLDSSEVGMEMLFAGALVGPAARLSKKLRKAFIKAKKMADSGESYEDILASTGWRQDPGLGWITRVSDKGAKMKNVSTARTDLKLKDVLKHPNLYKAYPKLKDVQVRVQADGGGSYGRTKGGRINTSIDRPDFQSIEPSGSPSPKPRFQSETLLHEVGHAVADIEGMQMVPMLLEDVPYDLFARALKTLNGLRNLPAHTLSEQQLGRLRGALVQTTNYRRQKSMPQNEWSDYFRHPQEQGAERFADDIIKGARIEEGVNAVPTGHRGVSTFEDTELFPAISYTDAAKEHGLPEWVVKQLQEIKGRMGP